MKRENRKEVMEVNWEQQKVITNPLRSRIIAMLFEQPMTPKQTADMLGKNPGTVYYHIQQLVKYGILEVESVSTEKGIVEKYYRAKAIQFRNPEQEKPIGLVDSSTANIYLSKKLVKQLSEELNEIYFKYGKLSFQEKDEAEQAPYTIEFAIKEYKEDEGG